jgi:serine/threonine protein phosphatase PrpC
MATLPSPSQPSKQGKQRPPMLSLPSSQSMTLPTKPVAQRSRIQEESSSGAMYGAASRRGKRRVHREDRCTILPFAANADEERPISIFGVFDGHGGQRAAHFASNRLPQLLLHRVGWCPAHDALHQAFLRTDKEFLTGGPATCMGSQRAQPGEIGPRSKSGSRFMSVALQRVGSTGSAGDFGRSSSSHKLELSSSDGSSIVSTPSPPSSGADASSTQPPKLLRRSSSRAEEQVSGVSATPDPTCGTTATVVLLHGQEMSVAHVGDSRAVLSSTGTAVRICEDHRPGREDEMARIESAGGLILSVGGASRVNGVLSVSRAIGDRGLKEFVVAEPDVASRILGETDEFLVVGSDGLWDFMDDQECVDVTRKTLAEGDDALERAAKDLVATACERGSLDDVSVLVIDLKKYRTLLDDAVRRLAQPELVAEASVEVSFAELSLAKQKQSLPTVTANRPVHDQCDPGPTPRNASRASAW